jgi:phosphoesterase RecJ-like protein
LTLTTTPPELGQIVDAIRTRERFVLSSHARPDGDAIGSELAMAYALRALGKEVRIVNCDPAPASLIAFPGVADIEIAQDAGSGFDAAIIME